MARPILLVDMAPLLRSLSDIEKKNLPFAESMALNETAFQAKKRLVDLMPTKFDLRNPRMLKGFRVGKATKRQDIITAFVYHLDAWLGLQETGGTKTSNSGKAMGIPALETQAKGRAPSGKIRERWWPRNLGKVAGFADPSAAGRMGGRGNIGRGLPKAFLMRSKSGAVTIVRRTKRGGGTTGRGAENQYDLIDLYYLKKSAHVKPRWDFVDTVLQVATANLAKNFERALFKATAFRS